MARYLEANYQRRKVAIEEALDVLGEPAKRTILSYLHNRNIEIETDYCSPIEEIEEALEGLLGSSTALIIQLVRARESR
jgi:hypothetical protein